MNSFNSILIDIVKEKKNCIIMGNNNIANDDVYDFMVSLIDKKDVLAYKTKNLYNKDNDENSFIFDLFVDMENEKVSIVSIYLDDIDKISTTLKNKSFENLEENGCYIVDIHERELHQDIYIKIYKLKNKKLEQVDLKGKY